MEVSNPPTAVKAQLNKFRKQNRKKQLNKYFDKVRKQLLQGEQNECLDDGNREIKILMKKIEDESFSNQSIKQLWDFCCMNSFRFLLEEDIDQIVKWNKIFVKQLKKENEQNAIRLLSTVANWVALDIQVQKFDYQQLISHCIQILEMNQCTFLNQLSLYTFSNLCFFSSIRDELIEKGVVKLALVCKIYPSRQSDVSLLFHNMICSLPFNYALDCLTVERIIYFLEISLQKSIYDENLMQDCILLCNKMLIVCEGKYHHEVIKRLHRNLQLYCTNLKNQTDEKMILRSIELVASVFSCYSQKYPSLCSVFSCKQIWHLWIKSVEILTNQEKEQENDSKIKIEKAVFFMISKILSLPLSQFPILSNILNEIQLLLSHGKALQHEEALVKLVGKFIDQEKFVDFFLENIEHYVNSIEICKTLIKRLVKLFQENKFQNRLEQIDKKIFHIEDKFNNQAEELSNSLESLLSHIIKEKYQDKHE